RLGHRGAQPDPAGGAGGGGDRDQGIEEDVGIRLKGGERGDVRCPEALREPAHVVIGPPQGGVSLLLVAPRVLPQVGGRRHQGAERADGKPVGSVDQPPPCPPPEGEGSCERPPSEEACERAGPGRSRFGSACRSMMTWLARPLASSTPASLCKSAAAKVTRRVFCTTHPVARTRPGRAGR